MTAKEFVQERYPDAWFRKLTNNKGYKIFSCHAENESIDLLAEAKTLPTAWSLAKKQIIENEKLKKHETQTT